MSYRNNVALNSAEGAKYAKRAWILGLIGLFFFGIIFGTLALLQAGKARALGNPATAGLVLGILAIIGQILAIVFLNSQR